MTLGWQTGYPGPGRAGAETTGGESVTGEYDAVVMGESDPSLSTFVFGMPATQVAERFLGPVLVVQRETTD